MFTTAMIAQSASSEAQKINRSRAKAGINTVAIGVTDGPAASMTKGDFGIQMSPIEGGVMINDFSPKNSSARAAKLKKGDVITAINNQKVVSEADIKMALSSYSPGEVVTVEYTRGNRKLTKDVRIGTK